MTIKHHLSDIQLRQFVSGDCSEADNMLFSAHISLCHDCQTRQQHFESLQSNSWLDNCPEESAPLPFNSQALLEQIMKTKPTSAPAAKAPVIEYQGKSFRLPKALRPLAEHVQPWSKVVGDLWRAKVDDIELGYQVDFIYIEPGGKLPQHSHEGLEHTLVLDGSFSDEYGHYSAGDIIFNGKHERHTPYSEKGCLCVAFIDAPLTFTQGFARLLNPFSHLFFKAG